MARDDIGLALADVEVELGDRKVLDGFTLTVGSGEFVSLLAPSGAGKSTVLNAIAGFLQLRSGKVVISGRDVTGLPSNQRDVGFIFQDFALFPHLDVEANIAFPLRVRGMKKSEIKAHTAEALKLVSLEGFGKRRPSELSGGQRQRVAIARVLVYRPRVLLMDEPLSSLDRALRDEMTHEIRRLQQELDVTVLYVTHDQQEALSLSDRIGVLRDGRIEQLGSPQEIHNEPRSAYVARLVGSLNAARPSEVIRRNGGSVVATFGDTRVTGRVRPGEDLPSDALVGVRPYALRIEQANGSVPGTAVENVAAAQVLDARLSGSGVEYRVEMEWGDRWRVWAPDAEALFDTGDRVSIVWSPDACLLMKD